MEQLKENGFTMTNAVTIINDKPFYQGIKDDGIYSYFRKGKVIEGKIVKPTGQNNKEIFINGQYQIDWKGNAEQRYYIVSI